MLKEVIRLFEDSARPLSMSEMAATLGIQESALDGMIELLVRKGRLCPVEAAAPTCAKCHGCSTCHTSPMQPKSYVLAGRGR